jgi:hypothetical protein
MNHVALGGSDRVFITGPPMDQARTVFAVAGTIIALTIALAYAGPLSAAEHRSRAVTQEFQREHPCPSTGLTTGACPGYRKDHMKALACGGADAVWNLQWQTVADARAKDRWERKACGR